MSRQKKIHKYIQIYKSLHVSMYVHTYYVYCNNCNTYIIYICTYCIICTDAFVECIIISFLKKCIIIKRDVIL